MDANQYEVAALSLQLFIQPSLQSIYQRNNRSMSQSDCLLTFPSIPLNFGLSSDLASGWSKLVYEQVITNKSKIEVEILGLGPQEAHVVEEAVKLLFGFKIVVNHMDLMLFLKVVDMLGLTQSPLSPSNLQTLQEQILEYCNEHIEKINLVEAWDYTISILESEPYTIHRNEIRKLGIELISKIKNILKESKFEVITNYAENSSNKFSLKEMKRENYIQLRSFFFNYINNEQKTNLNQIQNIVKVLFDDMDKHFELDGYINKYIDNIGNQMEELKEKLNLQQQQYLDELRKTKEKYLSEVKYLKEKQQQLKSEVQNYKKKYDKIYNQKIVASTNYFAIALTNDVVICYDTTTFQKTQIINIEQTISALASTNDKLAIGLVNGIVYIYQQSNKQFTLNESSEVKTMIFNKLDQLVVSYDNGKILVWNEDNIINQVQYDRPINVIYQHKNFGDFYVLGDTDGLIQITNITTSIKKMKQGNAPIVAFSNFDQQLDILVSATKDQQIHIWSWEVETILTVIKLESIPLKILSYHQKLIALLSNGVIQVYTFEKQAKFIEQLYVTNDPVTLFNSQYGIYLLTHQFELFKIGIEPLNNLSSIQLNQQTSMQHHTSCVYALALHNYPIVASSSDDKTIKLFSVKTHEVILTLKGHQAYVRALSILQDGKHLVSGSYDSTLKIWEISSGVCQNTLTGHTKPVLVVCVLMNTESHCLSGGEDATIKGWNWKQGTQIWRVEFDKNEVWSLLHVDSSVLSGHKDGQIRVVNQKDGVLEKEIKVHKSFINNILKLPQEDVILTGSSDNTMGIVNFKLGLVLRRLKGHNDIIWDMELLDEDIIGSSSTEGNIKLWDWKQGHCLNTIYCKKGSLYTMKKIPYTNKILCGTAQGDILIWKIEQRNSIALQK